MCPQRQAGSWWVHQCEAVRQSVNSPLVQRGPWSNDCCSRVYTYIAWCGARLALYGPTAGGSRRMINVVVSWPSRSHDSGRATVTRGMFHRID
jgi:hypothetical protein